MASLAEMPTELLLAMAAEMSAESLLHVAATLSRRLHAVFLPVFFARHRHHLPWPVPADQPISLSGPHMASILRGLHLSLQTSAIAAVDCSFNPGHDSVFAETRVLAALVARLRSLARLSLNLLSINFHDCPHDRRHALSRRWAEDLAHLLNAAVSRPDTHLSVLYGSRALVSRRNFGTLTVQPVPATDRDPSPVSSSSRRSPAHALKPILSKVVNRWGKRRRSTSMPPPLTISSGSTRAESAPVSPLPPAFFTLPLASDPQIQSWEIHSALLFHPPFREWTASTLNAAPIHTLSFDNLNHYESLGPFLESISLPHLRHISLQSSDVPFSSLLHFLDRHPTLRILDLFKNTMSSSSSSDENTAAILSHRDPASFLPNLESLIGTPEYITAFLQDASSAMYPNLSSITLTSDYHGMPPYGYQYSSFDRPLSCLGTRDQRDLSVTLIFLSGIGLEAWLRTASCKPFTSTINPRSPSLTHVKSMTFSTDSRFYFNQAILDALVMWIVVFFPGLEDLTFLPVCSCDQANVVRRLTVHCDNLQWLKINGAKLSLR
jgi:hypothetical protein